jgi:pimeloyl-ACP methyl ester carboxylesterase
MDEEAIHKVLATYVAAWNHTAWPRGAPCSHGALKRRYHAGTVVVVGHSGGAAIAANMLGRHPALIDAALVVSCPCDVEKWRQHMFQLTGQPVFQGTIDTLSPVEQITGMSDQANVTMMVGS